MNGKVILGTAVTAAGVAFPMKSLYNSGRDNRGFINSTFHFSAASAVGAGVALGGNAISGGAIGDVAKSIAKGVL